MGAPPAPTTLRPQHVGRRGQWSRKVTANLNSWRGPPVIASLEAACQPCLALRPPVSEVSAPHDEDEARATHPGGQSDGASSLELGPTEDRDELKP
jgi:hypothetical protein